MFEINITSTEIIKPASPTPPHLRTFNLSLLDQLAPQMFIPLIYYYPIQIIGTTSTAEISCLLKTSLSQILVHFYPLAGKFANDSLIDCNDQGVEFHESRVHYQLQDLIRTIPDVQALSQLVPCHHTMSKSGREDVLLAVQANFFDCGGLALGVNVSHFIGDMATFVTFVNSWASTAREHTTNKAHVPFISHTPLFPYSPGLTRPVFPISPNPALKKFVCSESNIAALRQKRSSQARGGLPTRVEAISALVYRCMARATKKVGATEERVLIVIHAVNLRSRMGPPLPENTFGNFWLTATTSGMPEREMCEDMEGCLEVELSNAIKKFDAAFVRKLQGPNGHAKAVESLMSAMEKHAGKDIEFCTITSWCRFPVYQADFGWGEPEWASPAPVPVKNGCILMDRRGEDGIEIWVNLNAEEMAKFEHDEELLTFVSPPTTTT